MTPPLTRWPDLHPHWRQASSAARVLNRAGLPTFPLRAVAALSIETADEYANGPGIVGPERRRAIRQVLQEAGYFASGPGTLGVEGWPARLQHPDPPDRLNGDPSREPERVASSPGRIALLTPIQAIYLLLRSTNGRMELPLQQELLHLVWEQTVDLPAVSRWAGRVGYRRLFVLLPALQARQSQGAELRARGGFRSLLPI